MNNALEKLIEHKQGGLVIDMAEHYFNNWVKENKDLDPFFFKVCKLAFKNGQDDLKFPFIKRMMKFSGQNPSLAEMIAEAYKEKEEYYRAYTYSFRANSPHMTVDLLLNHIIDLGYPNEVDLFKLRAVLEYAISNNIECAEVLIKKLWDENESNPHKNMAQAVIT